MSSIKNLKIGGIFITMSVSVLGYLIPYYRGAPKDHNSAFSTSWMSLKCFASGVIFSVALIHLLGESLEVLSENQDLLFPVHDEHEEEEHDEHEEEEEEGHVEEEGHEGHAHKFPVGLVLCCVGAVLTLGIELLGNIFISESEEGAETEKDIKSDDAVIGVEMGTSGYTNPNDNKERSASLCDDPFRLEPDHKHSELDDVHCHHDKKQQCSSSCSTDAHGDKNTKIAGGDIHRHVSIMVEKRQRSVLRSLVLEACIAVHSIIIGITVGSMEEYSDLSAFVAAISFHQFFEGVSLGTASIQACYSLKTNIAFVAVFILSLPLGIILGMTIPGTPKGEAVQACFSCIAAGSLLYTALVEMVAEDFAFAHSSNTKVDRTKVGAMYVAFIGGCTSMAILAIWA